MEPLEIYKIGSGRQERQKRVEELMDTVGLARRLVNSYPLKLDGGRQARLVIARALALNPKFIVCDEPVSAAGCFYPGSDSESYAGLTGTAWAGIYVYYS